MIPWIEESVPDKTSFNAHMMVEDFRGTAGSWEVRLSNYTGSSYLKEASLDWHSDEVVAHSVVQVHIQDAADEMSLGDAPMLMKAPGGSGAGIVVTQFELDYDDSNLQETRGVSTFEVLIPFAPWHVSC